MPTVEDVVTVSVAIDRTNGYVRKSDAGEGIPEPNVRLLYKHFYDNQLFPTTDSDRDVAKQIINYLQGLSFKAFERDLTSFEASTLKFVNADTVDNTTLGVAASLPNVYRNKLKQDVWIQREAELVQSSEFVGTSGKRGHFEVVVENVRFIPSVSSYLYCCSVDNKNILKFFYSDSTLKEHTTVCLSGYVKSHQISNYHGGKETMINRVKIEQVNLASPQEIALD